MLCNLRDSQTSKIIIHSKKLVLGAEILAIFSQDSRVKISNDSRKSHCEISVCKTQESCYKICLRLASLATKFVCKTRESRYKICLRDSRDSLEAILATIFVSVNREKRVLLLILTCKSHENYGFKKRVFLLARISKNDFSCQP
jgi:hypothetical protein